MMVAHLILLLDAPLMAFGVPQIDQNGPTGRFPGRSQLAGMLGNALGWDHRDTDRLQRLQDRIVPAGVLLDEGEALRDFQTVDLGQPFLDGAGWTTRGRPEERRGGTAATGTHIRLRWYRAGATVLVAVALFPVDEWPDVSCLAAALRRPARPLFIGRKGCLPALPPLAGTVEASDPLAALLAGFSLPPVEMRREALPAAGHRLVRGLVAEWPRGLAVPPPLLAEGPVEAFDEGIVFDRRNWVNQMHGGSRRVHRRRLKGWPSLSEGGACA